MRLVIQALLYFYATSIMIGRLYCGMHGFSDVIFGATLGALVGEAQIHFGDIFDTWVQNGPVQNVLVLTLLILVLVRVHPEPADDCPCYDDSVAFAGVVVGIYFGLWHFGQTSFSWSNPVHATVPFSLEELGILKTLLRLVLGIITIFMWRAVMKPTLLRVLPPTFRVIEKFGILLPRRFFLPVS